MIDDYYKILNSNLSSSLFTISLHYKTQSSKLLKPSNNFNEQNSHLQQIIIAYEVLKNEQIRKYYDILYRIFILQKPTQIGDETIEKYLNIINDHTAKGTELAERVINNEDTNFSDSIKRPLMLSFLVGTFMLYSNNTRLIAAPIGAIFFLVFGIIFILRNILGYNTDLWFIGTILCIIGIISLYVNFRYFTIHLMKTNSLN